jgi:hypothetical protein
MSNSTSSSSDAWTPDAGTASIFATLSLNGIICIVLLIVFEMVKGQLEVFYPRRRSKPDRTPALPPDGIFSWVMPVINTTDDEMLSYAGMDGYVFYRFLLMCFKIFSICAAIGLVVLLPVYDATPRDDDVPGIQRFTMGNILEGGNSLWAPWIMTYIFTGIFLYFIYKEYENFVVVRQKFLRSGDADISAQKNYSVMVENVPVEFRTSEKLKEFFNALFPDEVLYACISVDAHELATVVAERKASVNALEQCTAAYQGDPDRVRPELKLKKGAVALCGCIADETVDAMTHWTKDIKRLDAEVVRLKEMAVTAENAATLSEEENEAQKATDKADKKLAKDEKRVLPPVIRKSDVCGTGFVTFKSRRTQISACQLPVLAEHHTGVVVIPAPAPSDLLWANISTEPKSIEVISSYTGIMYKAGLLFYGLILAFIAAVSTLSNLETFLPFISSLDPVSKSIIEGQLPIIMVIVFIAMIPVIMTIVATSVQKRKTVSDVQVEVFNWFFLYSIANVYLMLLAGSIFNALSDAIDNPASIITLLGSALPTVSNFFINYMLTLLLTGTPVFLLRIGPLVVYKLFRMIFGEKLTRRTLIEGPLANFPINYGTILPKILYLVCIVQTYWVIAPILLGVGALLFGATLLVWKYHLMYVVVPNYQSGGVFFYGLFKYSMTGLMVSTVTAIAYMGIRQGSAQAPLMVPLIFIVLHVWRKAENDFYRLSQFLPFSMAVSDDLEADAAAIAELRDNFKGDYLRQPVFAAPLEAKAFPYRIEGTPLVTSEGHLAKVYWSGDAVAEPVMQENPIAAEAGDERKIVKDQQAEMTTNV